MFDWVFPANKVFNRSEILEEKFEQYEQKEANKQTNKKFKKKSNYVFEINCIWDSLYFHIMTFPWKNIYEGVPFYNICRHEACNWWLNNENDRRLGSTLSLRPISLVLQVSKIL